MSLWNSIFGNPPRPGSQGGPPRQVMPPRLINVGVLNPYGQNFANGNDLADFQKSVYFFPGTGNDQAPLRDSLENPFPMWIAVDLQMGPLKTARGHFPIPDNFRLLNVFASSSSNVNGGFKLVLYDNSRRIPLVVRPINFNVRAGTGSSPIFERVPYNLNPAGGEVKVKFTIYNLETVAQNLVQLGLYGVQATVREATLRQRIAAALHP